MAIEEARAALQVILAELLAIDDHLQVTHWATAAEPALPWQQGAFWRAYAGSDGARSCAEIRGPSPCSEIPRFLRHAGRGLRVPRFKLQRR
jgi:hypothetical protein